LVENEHKKKDALKEKNVEKEENKLFRRC